MHLQGAWGAQAGPFTLQNWPVLQVGWMLHVTTQTASQWRELPDELCHPPRCAGKGLVDPSAVFLAKPTCQRLLGAGMGACLCLWAGMLTWDVQLLAAALIYTSLTLSMGKQCLLFSLGTWRRVWIPVSQVSRLDGKGCVCTIKNTVDIFVDIKFFFLLKITKHSIWSLCLWDTDCLTSTPPRACPLCSTPTPPLLGCPLGSCWCPSSDRIMTRWGALPSFFFF